jgi:hypothetical protein
MAKPINEWCDVNKDFAASNLKARMVRVKEHGPRDQKK